MLSRQVAVVAAPLRGYDADYTRNDDGSSGEEQRVHQAIGKKKRHYTREVFVLVTT